MSAQPCADVKAHPRITKVTKPRPQTGPPVTLVAPITGQTVQ
jgi:hypothetical protein